MRPIDLSRDEAELLDDALLGYVAARPDRYDHRAVNLAAELCRIWGMAPWWKRDPAPMTKVEWDESVAR